MAFTISKLKRLCESRGVEETTRVWGEALTTRKIDPYGVRLAELREEFLGKDYFSVERKLKAIASGNTRLLEAGEAVDASAFSNITGQLLVTIIKEKYEDPEFIGKKLCETTPNPGSNLKEHKIPYLSDVYDKGDKLEAGQEYPRTKFAESWVTMPAPEKFGQVCSITMEMAMSDLTGQAQKSAASVGRALAYQEEERILRVILGLVNPYKWNDNSLTTYVATAGTGNYVNKKLSSTITNWTHINDVEQLFWRMVDPITGRRIHSRPTAVLCMPEKRYELKRVLNATEVRSGDTDETTSQQTLAANPLDVKYPILTSSIAQALMLAESGLNANQIKEFVIFADFKKFVGWRQVYPMKTEQAPAANPEAFNRDIVLQVKAGSYGVPYVYDPRHAVESTSEVS